MRKSARSALNSPRKYSLPKLTNLRANLSFKAVSAFLVSSTLANAWDCISKDHLILLAGGRLAFKPRHRSRGEFEYPTFITDRNDTSPKLLPSTCWLGPVHRIR